MADEATPDDQVRQLFGDAEKRAAAAFEELVRSDSFGELLARTTENAMALTRIGFDVFDLVVRNLRIAGRRDVARLGQQIARSEDKLERVLQEVEELRDELKRERSGGSTRSRTSKSKGKSDVTSSNGSPTSRSRSKST